MRIPKEDIALTLLAGMAVGLLLGLWLTSKPVPDPIITPAVIYELTSTAYVPTSQPTALLEEAIPGWTVATSRDHLELLGRKVYVTGLGLRRVTDLMAEGITDTVDICFGDSRSCKQYGRRAVKLVVLPEE